MVTRAWVEQAMGIHLGRYLSPGEEPVTSVTIPNILIEGVLVSITEDLANIDPVEEIRGVVQWFKDVGLTQAAPRAAAPAPSAPAPARPGPSQQQQAPQSNRSDQRAYSGGGNGYSGGGGGRQSYGGSGNGNRGGGGGGGYQPGNRGGGGNQGNWACPIHGGEKIGDGFRGGSECKVYSGQYEEWSKDKPYIDKDGNARFYCRESSQ